MKLKIAILPALSLALVLLGSIPDAKAVEGAPTFVDYQGLAYDPSGTPLGSSSGGTVASPTNYTMQFKIYDSQSATTGLIWAETQTVTVSLGQFSVRLGQGALIPGLSPVPLTGAQISSAFNNGKDRYLEVTVVLSGGTGTPILPRLAFQTSPFSFVSERAKRADSVGSDTPGTVIANGAGSSFTGTVNVTGSGSSFSGATISGGTFSGGTFSGNGSGLTNLNGNNLTNSSVPDGKLTTNVALLSRSNQTFSGSLGAVTGLFQKIGLNGQSSNVTQYMKAASGDTFLQYGTNSSGTNVFYVYNDGGLYAKGNISAGGISVNDSGGISMNAGRINVNNGGYGSNTVQFRAIAGDQLILGMVNSGGSQIYQFWANGTAAKPSGGSWAITSDVRLKKNINDLDGALTQLLKLRSVTFEYKDPKKYVAGRQTGFIAQEVEKIFPDWVVEGPDKMKVVSIHGFESLTVQALRELRDEMDQQIQLRDKEIAGLKQQLTDTQTAGLARDERVARLEHLLLPPPPIPTGSPAPAPAASPTPASALVVATPKGGQMALNKPTSATAQTEPAKPNLPVKTVPNEPAN